MALEERNNVCIGCGEDLGDPHKPGCERYTSSPIVRPVDTPHGQRAQELRDAERARDELRVADDPVATLAEQREKTSAWPDGSPTPERKRPGWQVKTFSQEPISAGQGEDIERWLNEQPHTYRLKYVVPGCHGSVHVIGYEYDPSNTF